MCSLFLNSVQSKSTPTRTVAPPPSAVYSVQGKSTPTRTLERVFSTLDSSSPAQVSRQVGVSAREVLEPNVAFFFSVSVRYDLYFR